MSTEASRPLATFSPFEQLRFAREVMRREGQALLELSERLQDEFCEAVDLLYQCRGNVIVTGMGKAGLIGQKVAATLASTGTTSHFLHPGEAVHGDLGRIHELDVVLALSMSGETAEVTRLLHGLAERETPVVAITGNPQSALGRAARVALSLGPLREACSLGLAPSTSTTAMLALGDALALVLSRMRGFAADDFARYHPGGSLGRRLARVEEVMRGIDQCRVARQTLSVRRVLVEVSRPGRRTGAVMLVDSQGCLTGLFTDSDLARILEHNQDAVLDDAIERVMTHSPTTASPDTMLTQAVKIMATRKISELPVVDPRGRPLGLIDITDLLSQEVPPATGDSASEANSSVSSVSWRAQTVRFPTADQGDPSSEAGC